MAAGKKAHPQRSFVSRRSRNDPTCWCLRGQNFSKLIEIDLKSLFFEEAVWAKTK